jgi:Protein of unknown function (DUF2852)
MFHLHHLILLPFFVIFHVVGFIFLFFAAAVLVKAVRRRSAMRCGESSVAEAPVSGNTAFDDYRRATLKKLELEAEEFRRYLDGLRRAADAAAFETFLKSRRAEGGPAA